MTANLIIIRMMNDDPVHKPDLRKDRLDYPLETALFSAAYWDHGTAGVDHSMDWVEPITV